MQHYREAFFEMLNESARRADTQMSRLRDGRGKREECSLRGVNGFPNSHRERGLMTHWDVARFTIIGGVLGFAAFAGWMLGGIIG